MKIYKPGDLIKFVETNETDQQYWNTVGIIIGLGKFENTYELWSLAAGRIGHTIEARRIERYYDENSNS